MALSQEFTAAVQSGDALTVRIMLGDNLLADPSAGQFGEREAYAVREMPELYVPHDGEELNMDPTGWTEDYLDAQMVALTNNFSPERVRLLKAMVKHIYPEKARRMAEKNARQAGEERQGQKHRAGDSYPQHPQHGSNSLVRNVLDALGRFLGFGGDENTRERGERH